MLNKLYYVNVIAQNLLRTQTLLKRNEEAIAIVNIIFYMDNISLI